MKKDQLYDKIADRILRIEKSNIISHVHFDDGTGTEHLDAEATGKWRRNQKL